MTHFKTSIIILFVHLKKLIFRSISKLCEIFEDDLFSRVKSRLYVESDFIWSDYLDSSAMFDDKNQLSLEI